MTIQTGAYRISVNLGRTTFTVGFGANDDAVATVYAIKWATKAYIPKGSKVRLVRPDGTEVDTTGLSEAT